MNGVFGRSIGAPDASLLSLLRKTHRSTLKTSDSSCGVTVGHRQQQRREERYNANNGKMADAWRQCGKVALRLDLALLLGYYNFSSV